MKSELFGFPADVISDLPSVRITGDTTAEIINHKGIKECDKETISVSTKLGVITVSGRDMAIKEINGESLKIEGKIISLTYAQEGK